MAIHEGGKPKGNKLSTFKKNPREGQRNDFDNGTAQNQSTASSQMFHANTDHPHELYAPQHQIYLPQAQPKPPQPPKQPKHELQVHSILGILTNPNNGQYIYLCKNQLGTRYLIIYFEIYLITDKQLHKKLKALINRYFNQVVTDRAIRDALDIVEGDDNLWIMQSHTDLPTRVSIFNDKAAYQIRQNNVFDFVANYYPRPADQYIGFKTQSDSKPFSDSLIQQLQDYSNYQHFQQNLVARVNSLYKFLCVTNIETKSLPILLTWAVHCLISADYVLLEITGEPENGKSTLTGMLKELIDYTTNIQLTPPKKHQDLTELVLVHHLLNFENVDTLSDEIQNDFVKLLSKHGLEINLSKKEKQLFTVRRPIVITNIESVVTNQSLIDKTISIELKEIENKQPVLKHLTDQDWEVAVRDLLFLSRHVFEHLNAPTDKLQKVHYDHNKPELIYHRPKMKSFVDIGLYIDSIAGIENSPFLDALNNLAKEQVDQQLNHNDIAFCVYKMAELNPGDSLTHSVSEWIEILSPYAIEENINLSNMTAHKLGREFKKAKPILKNYGIILESLGKQSRLVKWTITTPESIENNTYKPIATFSQPPHI